MSPDDGRRGMDSAASLGAITGADGRVTFSLLAPAAAQVELLLWPPSATVPPAAAPSPTDPTAAPSRIERLAVRATDDARQAGDAHGERPALALHAWQSDTALTGWRYRYRIDGGRLVGDPASRWNPDDVSGAAVVVDPAAYRWQCGDWGGLPWHRCVLYELHVGTFTADGTFAAAIERLDHLVSLGVTAIEVMPVADFPGRRGWGYDGVLPYAPDAAYGSPDDFRRFVDAAHARGIAVFLDVVYNHFGPDGNDLPGYAQAFFNPAHVTPWGDAINFDGPGAAPVRDFFVANAAYWIEAFRLDGLRLDAVHAIRDDSSRHLVADIGDAIRRVGAAATPPRPIHLILENDRNQASLLRRADDGAPLIATAQWNDDIHHALHVLVTGEADGYYADFADAAAARLADGLAHGFIYRGQPSRHADGQPRGEPTDGLPPTAFVNFLQNHDQVGNRAFGERVHALAPAAAVRAAAACVLLGPAIPMLFMGEEFAASAPFLYFCDFQGDLATAVREGRRREFGRFARFNDPALRDRIPDPGAESTFESSRLDWREATDTVPDSPHAAMLATYRDALAARARHVMPLLADGDVPRVDVHHPIERAFVVRWHFSRGTLTMAANFDPDATVTLDAGRLDPADDFVHGVGDVSAAAGTASLPPFSVALWLR